MKVTLLKAHEHARVVYPAGAEIDVADSDLAFLAEHGVIAGGVDTIAPLSAEDQPLSFRQVAERAAKGK